MKTLLLFFSFSLFTFSLQAQTIVFTGGGDGVSWEDAANWDTGAVPVATDQADLDGGDVVISTAVTLQRVNVNGGSSLVINAGATLTLTGFVGNDDALDTTASSDITNDGVLDVSNVTGGDGADGIHSRGLFLNNGTITVSGVDNHGINVGEGTFTNAPTGVITVSDVGGFDGDGDGITTDDQNSGAVGTFENLGMVSVDTSTGGDDGLNINDNSFFNNSGVLDIPASADHGILVDDGGTFTNLAGGTITITGAPDHALRIDRVATSSFVNDGTLDIVNCVQDGIRLENGSSLVNNATGIITITNSGSDGIEYDGPSVITNAGMITIMGTGGSQHGIEMEGPLNNLATGVIEITAGEGILTNVAGSDITNAGMINLMGNDADGIDLRAGSTITVVSGGTIIANLNGDDGIANNGGIIDNDGTIEVSNNNNTSSNTLIAKDNGDDGIRVTGSDAVITNSGRIIADGNANDDIETDDSIWDNVAGSILEIGCDDKGAINLQDNITFSGGTIVFEIASLTDFDVLLHGNSANTLDISGAIAEIVFCDGFVPAAGDCFTIVDAGSAAPTIGLFADVVSDTVPFFEVTSMGGGADVQICVPLITPVEFISFTGERVENSSLLNWETGSEIDNEGFEIQTSLDGQNWTTIDFIDGAGNSTTPLSYSYEHKSPERGLNFYRLKQIDFDGAFEFSDVVVIDFESGIKGVVAYPNPVIDVLNISSIETISEVQLMDASGKIIFANDGFTNQIPFNDFGKGVYYLRVVTPTSDTTQKVVY